MEDCSNKILKRIIKKLPITRRKNNAQYLKDINNYIEFLFYMCTNMNIETQVTEPAGNVSSY